MSPSTRSTRLSRLAAAMIGVLSVAAALSVGHLVAGLVAPTASPFFAVGNGAIDLTPTPLKNFAVRTFGNNDKFVLLLGMALVIGIVALVGGLLSRRSPRPGLTLIVVLGIVGAVAVIARPTFDAVDLVAPVASLVAGVAAFLLLYRLASRPVAGGPRHAPRATGGDDGGVSRRGLLVGSAAVAAGAGLAGYGGYVLTGTGNIEAARRRLGRIVPDEPAPSIPAGADFAAVGTPTFITPNSEFYRVDINLQLPQLTPEEWELRIHGMVDREITLNWDDLMAMRSVERTVTQVCVSNELGGPYISTTNYTGVRVRDLLAELGVRDGANQVFTTSVDGWTAGTPTETVLDPENDTLLVYAMNREPLPIEHGFPVRMFVPGLYGYISATKWITDLELTTFADQTAYWVQAPRNWGRFGPIKTMSRIDSPGSFERVPSDQLTLAGVAWAPTVGIERVEVRVDGGAWMQAELATEVNRTTWRMWKLAVPGLQPGLRTAQVRATDKSGYVQTPE
ncbi:MAG: molybdopterin-dependent oxidoreductase, partial [Actinomycetota bacterium]|nr:molybdopterin-dependent oxidoreductase [Actinomycetota bacterium]